MSIQDMLTGIAYTKHAIQIAQEHRKPAPWFTSLITGFVTGTLSSQHVLFIESMTETERHAELIYAESLFQKVLFVPFSSIINVAK
jgi:hypothetical protein